MWIFNSVIFYMNEESFDLNIENYNLEDILNLFKLNYNFVESDLKKAYRIALKLHPDKCNLDADYFRFYMKAYKVLEKYFILEVREKTQIDTVYFADDNDIDKNKALLLHKLNGKSVTEFNTWFNKMFEEVRIKDEEQDNGYSEWIKENKVDENGEKVSLSQFKQVFEKRKNECRALIQHKGIQDLQQSNGGSSLTRERIDNYSSDVFSKLRYEDFKKAHTETVIPVTEQDFLEKEKFQNVEMLKRHRDSQNTAPPSLQQSRQYLADKNNHQTEIDANRAFLLIKRDEEIEKQNKKWWANLQRLT